MMRFFHRKGKFKRKNQLKEEGLTTELHGVARRKSTEMEKSEIIFISKTLPPLGSSDPDNQRLVNGCYGYS